MGFDLILAVSWSCLCHRCLSFFSFFLFPKPSFLKNHFQINCCGLHRLMKAGTGDCKDMQWLHTLEEKIIFCWASGLDKPSVFCLLYPFLLEVPPLGTWNPPFPTWLHSLISLSLILNVEHSRWVSGVGKYHWSKYLLVDCFCSYTWKQLLAYFILLFSFF